MPTLKEYAQQAATLAVLVAFERSEGQPPEVRAELTEAVEALLRAKRCLSSAHRRMNGDGLISRGA